MSIPATYIDGTHFTVEGEFDGEYPWGRRIQAGQGVDDIAYTHVISATYSAVTDLVTIEVGHDVLTVNLISIHRGVGDKLSLGLHYHDSDTTDAGYMAASRLDDDAVDILLTLDAVPSGTGFRHVTAGSEDAAAKLVENADVSGSAAIAESKLALDYATADLDTAIDGVATDLSTHTGAAAPHSGHEATANKGAANGYMGLGADTYADPADLGGGTPDATKVLYGNKTWAVPPGASGGEANTVSSQGGGVSLYKQKSGVDLEFNSLDNSQFSLTADVISYIGVAGTGRDVRLIGADSNTFSLGGVEGTTKLLDVNGTSQDLSTPETIDSDSASDYLISESGGTVSIGSTALSALTTGYNDRSLLYLYMTDNSSCWNFSSPTTKDYRNSLIISDKAPTETGGYMASSGDGVGARHVGWACLESDRTMFSSFSVASAFNSFHDAESLVGTTASYQSLTTNDYTDAENCQVPVIRPIGWTLSAFAYAYVKNDSATANGVGPQIKIGTDEGETPQDVVGQASYVVKKLSLRFKRNLKSTSTEVSIVNFRIYADSAAGSPQYYPPWTGLELKRSAPN